MTKLFRNAKIVDVENGEIFDANILVENGRIKSFEGQEKSVDETIDLQGNYVLPAFVNSFMNSVEAGKENYFRENGKVVDESAEKDVQNLFLVKNLLAGAVFINDISKTGVTVVDEIENKNEKELSALSMQIAKGGKRPFIKLGQDLMSLGSVGKQFEKSAVLVLEDFGFLDRKPVIVGGNCLEKDDLETLKSYACDFVVLPSEDGKVGRRQTNLVSLLRKDLQVCVGSGNSAEIDFFAFMRQMVMSMRCMFEDGSCMSERDALKLATSGAVLGFENRLEVGETATFVVVSARESLYDDIFKTLVWERSKNDVLMSVKEGEVLQKNGEILMKNLPSYGTIIKNLKQ